MLKINYQTQEIEPASRIWHDLLSKNPIPCDGVVVEIAPGHEPKIGVALALLGFRGTIFLVEPDESIIQHIERTYKSILPGATVKIIPKILQKTEVGIDVPCNADVLLASHPFDDMVISSIVEDLSLFSREREGGVNFSDPLKELYAGITDNDYENGVMATAKVWVDFIEKLQPHYFIASQYPSRTLLQKRLYKRQASGFSVLEQLKSVYQNSLKVQPQMQSAGFKGDSKWWIVTENPAFNLVDNSIKPLAIKRLDESLFVPQQARKLDHAEYDIGYIDDEYFNHDHKDAIKRVQELAIKIDSSDRVTMDTVIAYADRQKDQSDLGLSGNLGSGRAVYYGLNFNVLGVGKTTLCKSTKPSHSTGRLELIGAMRRIILSKWINNFAPRAPIHPALIVLKESAKYKWHPVPIPSALLVRLDDESLDRPSHVECSPQISVDIKKTVMEYAKLDAECFAFRFMLGAWSTSNYSLTGHMIDLESVSFVKYRGPYYTSSAKYPHNRFGYEGLGLLKVLHQLAGVKKIRNLDIEKLFYQERREHLAHCFLRLLGVSVDQASDFFSKNKDLVLGLSEQFERLGKKVSTADADINLYFPFPDVQDPSLLDMSGLFRNLSKLYYSSDSEKKALEYLIRQPAVAQIWSTKTGLPANQAEGLLGDQAVVTGGQLKNFLSQTKKFVQDLFQLLVILDSGKYISNKKNWHERLQTLNQDLPVMSELNEALKSHTESFRIGKMSPQMLDRQIRELCRLPRKLS